MRTTSAAINEYDVAGTHPAQAEFCADIFVVKFAAITQEKK